MGIYLLVGGGLTFDGYIVSKPFWLSIFICTLLTPKSGNFGGKWIGSDNCVSRKYTDSEIVEYLQECFPLYRNVGKMSVPLKHFFRYQAFFEDLRGVQVVFNTTSFSRMWVPREIVSAFSTHALPILTLFLGHISAILACNFPVRDRIETHWKFMLFCRPCDLIVTESLYNSSQLKEHQRPVMSSLSKNSISATSNTQSVDYKLWT